MELKAKYDDLTELIIYRIILDGIERLASKS